MAFQFIHISYGERNIIINKVQFDHPQNNKEYEDIIQQLRVELSSTKDQNKRLTLVIEGASQQDTLKEQYAELLQRVSLSFTVTENPCRSYWMKICILLFPTEYIRKVSEHMILWITIHNHDDNRSYRKHV